MRKITSLEIESFKGIGRRVQYDLKPINLFFGQNSAGKSTVLHALNYLNDILNLHAINADGTSLGGGSINLGGFEQFVHQHNLDWSVGLGLKLDLSSVDLVETKAAEVFRERFEARNANAREIGSFDLALITSEINSADFSLEVSWSSLRERPYVSHFNLGLNGDHFVSIHASSDLRRVEITKLLLNHSACLVDNPFVEGGLYELFGGVIEERYLESNGTCLIGLEDAENALPFHKQPLKLADIWSVEDGEGVDSKAEFRALLSTLILGVLETAADELSELKYLGPIREIPPRGYRPRKATEYDWANGLAAWDTLFHEEEHLLNEINRWMHDDSGEFGLKTGYSVEIEEYKKVALASRVMSLIQSGRVEESVLDELDMLLDEVPVEKQVFLRDERRGIEVNPEDVGVGISQLLPVIVGALSERLRIFSIEQPELHIHPRLQAELGDLFIQAALLRDKTFLIETHSEHLMLRILRRIREAGGGEVSGTISGIRDFVLPEDINVVYVDCVQGETRLIPMGIDGDGEFIDRWPHGFFGERAEELF
ncbi:AAA family ATPase [Parahaliea maris]|uniref:AAA family ATPase n=1 Tax=Parahaliea maris TaxID=2716870 RepID=A0A5C8ZZD8_9GAMM|nr:DUF3696 domain-containing protein [Parahaliea maris]TXS92757.1 AAA family ATPase [Parahaliea maris]